MNTKLLDAKNIYYIVIKMRLKLWKFKIKIIFNKLVSLSDDFNFKFYNYLLRFLLKPIILVQTFKFKFLKNTLR